jgi:hypothetical protein
MIGNYHFPSDYGCSDPDMPLCRKRSRRNRDAPIRWEIQPIRDYLDTFYSTPLRPYVVATPSPGFSIFPVVHTEEKTYGRS